MPYATDDIRNSMTSVVRKARYKSVDDDSDSDENDNDKGVNDANAFRKWLEV